MDQTELELQKLTVLKSFGVQFPGYPAEGACVTFSELTIERKGEMLSAHVLCDFMEQ